MNGCSGGAINGGQLENRLTNYKWHMISFVSEVNGNHLSLSWYVDGEFVNSSTTGFDDGSFTLENKLWIGIGISLCRVEI